MKKIPLSLEDICPKDTYLKLDAFPDKEFLLSKFSLRVRAWAIEKFGEEKLQSALSGKNTIVSAEIAYFMLKDKALFPKLEDFLEAIASPMDQHRLITTLMGCIGVSEPKLEEISQVLKENEASPGEAESPSQSTGAKSTTPSDTVTAGQ